MVEAPDSKFGTGSMYCGFVPIHSDRVGNGSKCVRNGKLIQNSNGGARLSKKKQSNGTQSNETQMNQVPSKGDAAFAGVVPYVQDGQSISFVQRPAQLYVSFESVDHDECLITW
eukprot:CAMPEP_0175041090 /NCGR_PEP_ID=MMETSP0052_2-20121109/1703_1 /TAXON_ID=51329 ORGANISM="Polytomella parva, Strain SAG 63-3" /NCGR_SAMPLE_ID=MMETSP0052_2 /ASSEMBLY_ACC=CAM_ASM_000194 /LENGTH=113 /DNA_ID=CAMNT_0016303529 /DNA_START=73 /DNA_END=411 /DNA_ORIENTATION=+